MELHQVRCFLAVATHLNFTRAAEALRIAQPSLTRAIQKLEAELAGPLFRRERSNTHLTELGRMMLPHLRAAHAAATAAQDEARRLRRREAGGLALGVSTGIAPGRPAALVIETARRMGRLDLSIKVAPSAAVERRLMAGEFDAAILAPGGGVGERLDLREIGSEALVVAFGPDHRFAERESVPLAALDTEPMVAHLGCPDEALAAAMGERGLARLVRHRSDDPGWLAALVRGGLGCAIVPATLAEAHALAFRALDGIRLRHSTMLATVAGRRYSPALAALIGQVEGRT